MSEGGEPDNERSKEQHLRKAFSEIERVSAALDIPTEVVTFAETMYRQMLKDREEQYWDIDTTAMSVLYLASKVQGEPVDPEEICSVDRVSTSRKYLLRRAKKINNILSLDIAAFYDSSSYIDGYCEELRLGDDVRKRAEQIVDICSEAGIAGGKSPRGWAAAAIYLASTEHDSGITQDQLADIANVTTVTIRNRYQEQRDAVLEYESLPADPYDILDWFSERLDVNGRVEKRAHTILTCGQKAGYPIDDSAAWPAAALRRASEEYELEISKKALKEPIAEQSQGLNSRVKQLKEALRSSPEYQYLPNDR